MSAAVLVRAIHKGLFLIIMERDVAEGRPGKQRRGERSDSDIEEDSGYHTSGHSSSEDMVVSEDPIMNTRVAWTAEDLVPASYIEGLECQARSMHFRDTEWVEDDFIDGSWRCCRNPCCYRCMLIDHTETDMMQEEVKGFTVQYIGNLRNTESWKEMDVKQRIGKIGQFLALNRDERTRLRRTGVIRLNLEEAKKVIEEKQYLGDHFMNSPRTSNDKKFRISATRMPCTIAGIKSGTKLFMRGDIRDMARYFEGMEFMKKIEGTTYTREGQPGTLMEHAVEITGAIVESILGLGMVYEDFKYEELEDMPAIVACIEEGLMAMHLERRSARRYMSDYHQTGKEQWKWDEYDEVWGFSNVPRDHPDYVRELEAHRLRQAGIPEQLEEDELEGFYARMRRRGETRLERMRDTD
jgi:hypothetical protein